MKNKILLVLALVLFSSVVCAQTAELTNLIDAYHKASEDSDAQKTINLLYYPEGTAGWFKEDEKKVIEETLSSKRLKDVSFDFVKEEIFNQGINAYVEISITGGEVVYPKENESTLLRKEHLFFIFEKQNNQWKILNYSATSSDFNPLQKEEYVKLLKEDLFALIEEKKGFDPNPPDTNKGQGDQNALVGIFDFLLGLVSIGIVIVVILIVFFSLTGKKNGKKPSDQKVVVNVQTPTQKPATENQSTQKPLSETKPAEQAKPQTKKDYSDAMKLLRKRYASGEITKQQFEEMKKELGV